MRWTSNPCTRSGILSAAVLLLASGGAIGSPASAAEPAKLAILSGDVAALLQLQMTPPSRSWSPGPAKTWSPSSSTRIPESRGPAW